MTARTSPASAVERTEQAIARIDKFNPQVNAFTHFTYERALSEAKAVDRR